MATGATFFEERFRAQGTAARAAQEKRYLKSAMDHFGVPVPGVRAAAKAFRKENPRLSRADLLALVETMWASRWYEIRSAAIALLELYAGALEPRDMDLLEGMLDECETWAHVDWIAPHVAGKLAARYPECNRRLDRWARHGNFWVRRAAMLALLGPLRATGARFDQFAGYAEAMLDEKEFFIRKAIGWILREVSRKNPELASAFLMRHLDRVSGLTFKEGSRRLPERVRLELEEARRRQ